MMTLTANHTIETRGVLAGAYRSRKSLGDALTHSVEIDAEGNEVRALCSGRVKVENIADKYSGDTARRPTCPHCLARDPRFAAA
jgi:hypothetical protein